MPHGTNCRWCGLPLTPEGADTLGEVPEFICPVRSTEQGKGITPLLHEHESEVLAWSA